MEIPLTGKMVFILKQVPEGLKPRALQIEPQRIQISGFKQLRESKPANDKENRGVADFQTSLKHYLCNSLRPRPNRRHFADDIFKCIFKNVPNVRINNIPALVHIMAWRRPGDKPLSESMIVSLLTHICVTRPQWVNCCMISVSQNKDSCGSIVSHISIVVGDGQVHVWQQDICICCDDIAQWLISRLLNMRTCPGCCLNMKMSSYQHRDARVKDKMVLWSPYL